MGKGALQFARPPSRHTWVQRLAPVLQPGSPLAGPRTGGARRARRAARCRGGGAGQAAWRPAAEERAAGEGGSVCRPAWRLPGKQQGDTSPRPSLPPSLPPSRPAALSRPPATALGHHVVHGMVLAHLSWQPRQLSRVVNLRGLQRNPWKTLSPSRLPRSTVPRELRAPGPCPNPRPPHLRLDVAAVEVRGQDAVARRRWARAGRVQALQAPRVGRVANAAVADGVQRGHQLWV